MNCPYCNSPVLLNDVAGNPWYKCGTTKTFRSASCVDREPIATELRNAQDRIKRLEEAGGAMLNAWLMPEDSMEYCDWVALSADAKAKWYKAKEAKP